MCGQSVRLRNGTCALKDLRKAGDGSIEIHCCCSHCLDIQQGSCSKDFLPLLSMQHRAGQSAEQILFKSKGPTLWILPLHSDQFNVGHGITKFHAFLMQSWHWNVPASFSQGSVRRVASGAAWQKMHHGMLQAMYVSTYVCTARQRDRSIDR